MDKRSTAESDDCRALWHVGECRICGGGVVGVRACGHCYDLTLLCDECDAAWTSADCSATPRLPQAGDVSCASCGASLSGSPAHWANLQEIASTGWLAQSIAAGQATLASS